MINLYFALSSVPLSPFFYMNSCFILVKEGFPLPSSVYIALTSGVSCFSGAFAIKARNLPVLIENKAVRANFEVDLRSDEASRAIESTTKGSGSARSCYKHAQQCCSLKSHAWSDTRPCYSLHPIAFSQIFIQFFPYFFQWKNIRIF